MVKRLTVGQRLRNLREAKGLTQGQLGMLLSPAISHAAVSDIERGVTSLDIERLTILAHVLDGDLQQLLEPDPPEQHCPGCTRLHEQLADANRTIAALQADRATDEATVQRANERAEQAEERAEGLREALDRMQPILAELSVTRHELVDDGPLRRRICCECGAFITNPDLDIQHLRTCLTMRARAALAASDTPDTVETAKTSAEEANADAKH